MAYNGSTTTTIEQQVKQQSSGKVNKVLSGGGDSGNDSLITTQCSQDSAIVMDELEDMQSTASTTSVIPAVPKENEGDVNSIFLCEFHPTAGPKITLQVPNDHVTSDLFRIIHQYIIPKVPLQGSFLSM